METKAWALESLKRSLLNQSQYDSLFEKLKVLHYKLNIYIKKLKTHLPNHPIS